MTSSWSLARMLPAALSQFDWAGAYLAADLAARGAADIPGWLKPGSWPGGVGVEGLRPAPAWKQGAQ